MVALWFNSDENLKLNFWYFTKKILKFSLITFQQKIFNPHYSLAIYKIIVPRNFNNATKLSLLYPSRCGIKFSSHHYLMLPYQHSTAPTNSRMKLDDVRRMKFLSITRVNWISCVMISASFISCNFSCLIASIFVTQAHICWVESFLKLSHVCWNLYHAIFSVGFD
jgi:hypothetical protein